MIRKGILLLPLAVMLVGVALQAQSALSPDTVKTLEFPKATPWGQLKPSRKYDKFADSSRVWLSVESVIAPKSKGLLGGLLQGPDENPRVTFTAGYSFPGMTARDTVRSVTLLITAEKGISNRTDVKNAIGADARAPIMFILGDGSRLRLEGALVDNDVDVFGTFGTKTSVTYGTTLPIETFLRILNSAPTKNTKVEGRAGTAEFVLDQHSLEALRNFAGHMLPGA